MDVALEIWAIFVVTSIAGSLASFNSGDQLNETAEWRAAGILCFCAVAAGQPEPGASSRLHRDGWIGEAALAAP